MNERLIFMPVFCFVLDIAFSFNLKQVVVAPSWVTAPTSSLVDLVFVSDAIDRLGFTVGRMPGISDHDLVLFKSNMPRPVTRKATKQLHDFNNAKDESILELLEQECENFSARHSDGYTSPNELWLDFKSTVHKCIHRNVPLRKKKNS